MTDTAPAIELVDVEKAYPYGFLNLKRRRALGPLTLSVPRGQIVGYLGPNGAGKTTTLKLLTGLARADAGSIRVLGVPVERPGWRFRTGFLPEHPYFYDYLRAPEYLDHVGQLFGIPRSERHRRTDRLLAQVGLDASSELPMRRYSKGMVQRLGLAQALINDPELVILDEPMSGLDPLGRQLVRDLILALKQNGKTVFFSTHVLPDAEALCDRIALIHRGRLLEHGQLHEILDLSVSHVEVLVSGVAAADLDGIGVALRRRVTLGDRMRLEVAESAISDVVRGVEAAGGRLLEVRPIRDSLEQHFLKRVETDSPAA